MSIVLKLSDRWKSTASLELLGCIHDFEKHESTLASVENIESWVVKLKDLKGFYSLVKQDANQVFAAVDHIRSRPLFYASTEQNFYLSDSAEWVRQQVNDTFMDEFAKAEFQLTGYVTGRDTLYKNVKQLQAGECLVYANNQLAVECYYTFDHREPESYREETLLEELDGVAKKSIQRLIQYANGRQIVIPLSGGYDSRLIATLLKEANYENILAFTYGAKGNKEADYSKIVADKLGLKWHFIEYTEALWKAAWKTEERKAYQVFGSGWNSIPHVQDWLAVKIMKEQGIVQSDAVFAPGHSGDMVAGSHIPSFIHQNLDAKYTKDKLVEHLFNKHYCLTIHENVKPSISAFKEKIENSLVLKTTYSAKEFANECERYNWQNRQSKFIFNSVRVYEFFDYDWWIPLWDKEFVKFFEGLPLCLRNHEWYKEYVNNKYLDNNSGKLVNIVGNFSLSWLIESKIKKIINKHTKLKEVVVFLYNVIFKRTDSMARSGRYDKKLFNKLSKEGYNLTGITVFIFLIEFDL